MAGELEPDLPLEADIAEELESDMVGELQPDLLEDLEADLDDLEEDLEPDFEADLEADLEEDREEDLELDMAEDPGRYQFVFVVESILSDSRTIPAGYKKRTPSSRIPVLLLLLGQ